MAKIVNLYEEWEEKEEEKKIGKHRRLASICMQSHDLSETIWFLISHFYAAVVVAINDFSNY